MASAASAIIHIGLRMVIPERPDRSYSRAATKMTEGAADQRRCAMGSAMPTTRKRPTSARIRNRRSAEDKLAELKERLAEISDLDGANSLLSWDQATYMPDGGADARGRQSALLGRLAHERLIDPAPRRLIDGLGSYAERLDPDSDDARLIRVARRDVTKAAKVPADHVARATAHASASYDAWTRARPANDFAAMLPFLERGLELSREYADYFAP